MHYRDVFTGINPEEETQQVESPTLRSDATPVEITHSEKVISELEDLLFEKIENLKEQGRDYYAFHELTLAIKSLKKYHQKWIISEVNARSIEGLDKEEIIGLEVIFSGCRDPWFVCGKDLFTLFKRNEFDKVYRYRVPYLSKLPVVITERLDIMPLGEWYNMKDFPLSEVANLKEIAQYAPLKEGEDPRYWNLVTDAMGNLVMTKPESAFFKVNYHVPDAVPAWKVSLFGGEYKKNCHSL